SRIAAVGARSPPSAAPVGRPCMCLSEETVDAPVVPEAFLFENYKLDHNGLAQRDQSGAFVPVVIGLRALKVLGVLVQRADDLISRDEIMTSVGQGRIVESSNLPVQIAALRRILDEGRAGSSCIQTVAGRGYRFVSPVTRASAAARLPLPDK